MLANQTARQQGTRRGCGPPPTLTLGFTVRACAEEVDRDHDEQAQGDPDTVVDLGGPEVDQDSGRGQFGWQDDRPIVPVIPAHREGEGLVDEPGAESDVTTGDGEVGDHLSERDHCGETDRSHERITHEQTERSTVGEGSTGTEEETCTAGCQR